MMGSGKLAAAKEVKNEMDDWSVQGKDEEPITKRSKLSSNPTNEYNLDVGAVPVPKSQYNPLDEPSPLGLRLRKSPSLLDLIEMRLSQVDASKLSAQVKKEQGRGSAASVGTDKLKASNFPALSLRIGAWEYTSRYEGDLVAKCYFAKHKLVWEVLDGGLKNKIEIQWSDIVDIKAHCPDSEPATLNVVLARQPLFFKETNPQPRKHTLWQATTDFTGGEATLYRRHFLQCSHGVLGKHFDKLMQCDPRLNYLSRQPEIHLESLYFESTVSVVENGDDAKCHTFDVKNDKGSVLYRLSDEVSHDTSHLSLKDGGPDPKCSGQFSCRTSYSPEMYRSNMNKEATGLSHWDQLKVQGLHSYMPVNDLMSHFGYSISGENKTGNMLINQPPNKHALEEISQCLLTDSQLATASDEHSIMSRVNSLCCMLEKETAADRNMSPLSEKGQGTGKSGESDCNPTSCKNKGAPEFPVSKCESSDLVECKQTPLMPRKDSVGDLLLNLPRIASFPQFLLSKSDEYGNQAR